MTAWCSFRDRQLAGLALERAGSVTRLRRRRAATDDPLTDPERPARHRACAPSAMSGQLLVWRGEGRRACRSPFTSNPMLRARNAQRLAFSCEAPSAVRATSASLPS
jgi:hypothetical protein